MPTPSVWLLSTLASLGSVALQLDRGGEHRPQACTPGQGICPVVDARPLESFLGLIKGFWKKEIPFPLELLNGYSPQIDSCYSLATQREHVDSRGEYSFHKEDERGERWERKCVLTILFKDPPLSRWMASSLLVSFLLSFLCFSSPSFLSFPPCLSSFLPSFWNTLFGIGFLYICNWNSSDFMPVQSFRQSLGTGVGNKGLTNGSLNERSTFRCSTKLFFFCISEMPSLSRIRVGFSAARRLGEQSQLRSA